MSNPKTGSATPADPSPRTAWWLVLLAPWWGIVRPIAAARCLACQPVRLGLFTYLITLTLVGFITVAFALWDAGRGLQWGLSGRAPAWVAIAWPIGQVWNDWHADGWFGRAEKTLLGAVLVGLLGSSALAWLYLPFVHCLARPWHSFKRSLAAAATTLGTATLAMGILWWLAQVVTTFNWLAIVTFQDLALVYYPPSLIILLSVFIWRSLAGKMRGPIFPIVAAGMILGVLTIFGAALILRSSIHRIDYSRLVVPLLPLALCLLVLRIDRALRSVRPDHVGEPDLPPTCEGCGYDLTLQPGDGRCPECGRPIRQSLDPTIVRSGTPWERKRQPLNWVRAYSTLVLTPRSFYEATRLRRGDDGAAAFSRWMYCFLGCGGACWFSIAFLWGNRPSAPSFGDMAFIFLMGGMGTALVCWLGHRIGGAIVTSLWLVRQAVPDYRWSAKVIDYESAYLSVYCIFWGLTMLAVIADMRWGSMVSGRVIMMIGPIPMRVGVVIFIVGTVALSVGWYWRYQIALRAIRWNNF